MQYTNRLLSFVFSLLPMLWQVIVANTCRRNGHGIGVYTLTVGPVSNNLFFGNTVTNNDNEGITVGGLGHDAVHVSQKNGFFANTATGNNRGTCNLSCTCWWSSLYNFHYHAMKRPARTTVGVALIRAGVVFLCLGGVHTMNEQDHY